MTSRALTAGYGNRQYDVFAELLIREKVEYLIDVRSYPVCKWNESYSKNQLREALAELGIKYLFLGDVLGGRPQEDSAYVDGILSYARTSELESFKRGLGRLTHAAELGCTFCIMCSELRPEECHRCKLVAQALEDVGIKTEHIDGDGSVVSHSEVMARIPDDLVDRPGKMFSRR